MGKQEKLIQITKFDTKYNEILGTQFQAFAIYQSKGLQAHLMKRKHYVAVKYIGCLDEMISNPDYIGITNGNIELVKKYKENIFICIKLDHQRNKYFVATMFETGESKIDAYVKSGRLKKVIDYYTR